MLLSLILDLEEANLILRALKTKKTEVLEDEDKKISFDPEAKLIKRLQKDIPREYSITFRFPDASEEEIRKKIVTAQLEGKNSIELKEFKTNYADD